MTETNPFMNPWISLTCEYKTYSNGEADKAFKFSKQVSFPAGSSSVSFRAEPIHKACDSVLEKETLPELITNNYQDCF